MTATRRLLLLLSIPLPIVPFPLAWAAPSPQEIVSSLYQRAGGNAGWEDMLARAMGRKRPYTQAFDAALQAAEAKSRRNDEPWLDFDPVSNSQDPSIHGLTVATVSEAPDKATVRAEFRYEPATGGRVSRVLYDFVTENGAWALDDIRGGVVGEKDSNWSLRRMAGAAMSRRK